MKPTEEQTKKFWEWYGLKYEADQDEFRVILPDGEFYNFGHDWKIDEIDPPITLNNLFKWAVPKTIIYLMGNLTYDRISATKFIFDKWLEEYIQAGCIDFDSALFRAIQKVKEGE